MKKKDVVFSEQLLDSADQMMSLILNVNINKPMLNNIVVMYPFDVPSWATFGIALQVSALTNRRIFIYNPSLCTKYCWKVLRAIKGKGKMLVGYKALEHLTYYTRFYHEMQHNTSTWTKENTDFNKDIFPLLHHDYLTAAIIARYSGCPEEYITQKDLDLFASYYKVREGVIHVESL